MSTAGEPTEERRPVRESAAASWQQTRARLIARAEAEGLIDVAVERHDSPLGRLLVAATASGLVRLGLPGSYRRRDSYPSLPRGSPPAC